jgi:TRAP-type mannitol/chloroaromatic compound transport system permease large subunit
MEVVGRLAGALRGGLGLGIVFVGVLMGATTGIVGATVVTLGLLTLPALLRAATTRGWPAASSAPRARSGRSSRRALILILLADIMNLSVGTLFAAAVFPGLMLAGIY